MYISIVSLGAPMMSYGSLWSLGLLWSDCELKQEMCLRAENFFQMEKFDFGHTVNIFESAFRDFKKVSQALSKIQLQLKLSTHSILQRKVNFQSLS